MGHTARIKLLMCVLVYAVPAILSGIALFINSASIADEVWVDADFRQMMDDYGLVSSRDEILDVISYSSIMVLISGICAADCALLIHLGRFRLSRLSAAALKGVVTFLINAVGVRAGSVFVDRFGSKSEILGGTILILIGFEILLEHLGILRSMITSEHQQMMKMCVTDM